MFYICDKFGFVSEFYKTLSHKGEEVIKVRHCIDAREALPFDSRGVAEAQYRLTYMSSWWHCVVKV
jgi:hypothetical protein